MIVTALIIGLVCGFVGSVPVAGPIAALVLARSLAGRRRDALGIAWGAALAESLYAGLACWGVGLLFDGRPELMVWARGVASVILIGVGISLLRAKAAEGDLGGDVDRAVTGAFGPGEGGREGEELRRELRPAEGGDIDRGGGGHPRAVSRGGLVLGATITLFNPTLLATWSTVTAWLFAQGLLAQGLGSAALFALGASLGIGLWFTLGVALLSRFRRRVSGAALTWIQRGFGAAVIALGVYGLLG